MPSSSPLKNRAIIKSRRHAASMSSASTSEEGPNLLALDRRASNHNHAEHLSLENARAPKQNAKDHRQTRSPQAKNNEHRRRPPYRHPKDFNFSTELAKDDTASTTTSRPSNTRSTTTSRRPKATSPRRKRCPSAVAAQSIDYKFSPSLKGRREGGCTSVSPPRRMMAFKTSPTPWPSRWPRISPGQSPRPCHPNIALEIDEDARFHGLGVGTTRSPAAVFRSDAGSTGRPPHRERPPRYPCDRGDGLQHQPTPPAPGTAPPSLRRGHCLRCIGPHWEGRRSTTPRSTAAPEIARTDTSKPRVMSPPPLAMPLSPR
jgi:hypothetical protein